VIAVKKSLRDPPITIAIAIVRRRRRLSICFM
jgi:hypothetical protein